MCHIFTNISNFYECATFLPILAIFMSAPLSYQYQQFLRVRHIFTNISNFYECVLLLLTYVYECASLLPFLAIFTSVPRFCHWHPSLSTEVSMKRQFTARSDYFCFDIVTFLMACRLRVTVCYCFRGYESRKRTCSKPFKISWSYVSSAPLHHRKQRFFEV